MLSASRSPGAARLGSASIWRIGFMAGFVILLTLVIAGSTVQANWVGGVSVLVPIALLGAVVMGTLAVVRFIPWPIALAAGLLPAPAVAYVFAASALHSAHPGDPTYSLALVNLWWSRFSGSNAAAEEPLYLYLLGVLFWVVGGWLAWCVMRWRQPLLGLVPGAAAFATNILNYPTDQNGYTLWFMVLTLGLLLCTSYQRSVESAVRLRLRLSGDARWDFWQTGVVATAAVVALGIFLPPLSRQDTTVDMEGGAFRNWAELNQQLNHPVAFGHGAASGTSIGFAENVPLGGSIHRTGGVVLTYTIEGQFTGNPRYFRGLNLVRTQFSQGQAAWRYASDGALRQPVPRESQPPYVETYDSQTVGTIKIQMLKPPATATDALFYPGQLLKTDRDTIASTSEGYGINAPLDKMYTVDRLSGVGRTGGSGPYTVQFATSTASEDQLRAAGTSYPNWLDPYRNFATAYRTAQSPDPSRIIQTNAFYRPPSTINKIHDLAARITTGQTDPYDMANAIESYLRSNYTYSTTVADPPRDVDPVEFFLFDTKTGYCEYFASAMGDMLRSLGIPTRLVNGYGPGNFDDKLKRYVVRESDAHTWVEVYHPKYGWIPFEPTPDGVYFPIPRGSGAGASCSGDTACQGNGSEAGGTATDPSQVDKGAFDAGGAGGGSGSGLPLGLPPAVPIGLAVALMLGAAVYLGAARYLRPRTVGGVWNRTAVLCRLAGVAGSPGETPHEFGRRISDEFPETSLAIRALSDDFAVAAYAPPERARTTRDRILETWAELRPLLLGRVRSRFRLAS